MIEREVTEVRGSEARCSGPEEAPHGEIRVKLPPDGVALCPKCGRAYRRSQKWKQLSSAIWPQRK